MIAAAAVLDAHYLHTVGTPSARTNSRFVLPVNMYGTADMTHVESGMRYQISSSRFVLNRARVEPVRCRQAPLSAPCQHFIEPHQARHAAHSESCATRKILDADHLVL